jgi:inorganic phosphate transporter, PiT family
VGRDGIILFYFFLAAALLFNFQNGFQDSASLVAPVIASRSLPPRTALFVVGMAEFVGPFLFGTAVAATIGAGLLAPGVVTMLALICALGAAIGWNLITWWLGMPSSSSHALVGGMVGAAIASAGWDAVIVGGLLKIVIALLLSPLLGMAAGFLIMRFLLFLCQKATPGVSRVFRVGQIFTSLILALSHSANDAQKTMGVIALGLVIVGWQPSFAVPVWVILVCAGAMALGSSIGAWRLIRTLGARVITVRPIHGFAAQLSGAVVVLGAALLGGQVSSTQVLSSTLMGVGSAERITKVRWETGREMLWAWLITIPICVLAGAALYWVAAIW